MNDHSSLLGKMIVSAFRLKTWLVVIFVAVMGTTLLVTFTAKKQYASTMQIVVRDSREKPLVVADKATPESNPDSSQELIESHAAAEYEMLSANDILEKAVEFRAKVLPGAPDPAPGSAEMAKEIKKLSGRLKITPVRKTPVLEVTYRDRSPEAAQKVLEEVQRADLEKHLRVLRPSGTSKVFSELEQTFDHRLGDAQNQLSSFQVKNGVVSLSGEMDSLSKDRDATRSALLQEEAALATDQAQIEALRETIAKTPPRISTTARESANSYSMQQVTSVLVDLVNRRTQMLTRYQPADRLVTELDTQIADTNARLTQLKNEPNLEKDSDNNPVWLQAQQQVAAVNVAMTASKARSKTLAAQLDTIDGRIKHLESITAENDRLERSVDELKDNQRLYADKVNSELLEDVLDRDKFGNIAVAMEPTFSRHAVSPNVPLNIVLGFLTAVAVCGMFLFSVESHRNTFYAPAELAAATGVRVLGVVPDCPSLPAGYEQPLVARPAFIARAR